MKKDKIESILTDESFLKELKQAIESGRQTDWDFNGEDEFEVQTFEVDIAMKRVMEVLKGYLENEK